MRKALFALSAFGLSLALTGCGGPVSEKSARACIADAFRNKSAFLGGLGRLIQSPNFAPNISVSDIKLGECSNVGPATYQCLLEYKVAFQGGDEGLGGMMNALRQVAGQDDNSIIQTYWRFSIGKETFQCAPISSN